MLSASCRDERVVTADFVELFPQADVVRETDWVDFGTPEGRRHLLSGWSLDEVSTGGFSFVWSVGAASQLYLFLAEARPLTLSFRCWPFLFEGAPTQTVEVRLNHEVVTELSLARPPTEYNVELPAELQLEGNNLLELRYGYNRSPREVVPTSSNPRRLGVGWDWLRVGDAFAPVTPSIEGEGKSATLAVPFGTRVDFLVSGGSDAALVFDALRPWGEEEATGDVSLLLRVTAGPGDGLVREEFYADSGEVELPLPEGERLWISFQAKGGSGSDSELRGIELAHPRILSEPLPPEDVMSLERARPNIVVYLIDTLRADHLGSYGYENPVSPRIDAFAEDATLFERAYAQSSWTRSSVVSLFTGLHPSSHGVNGRADAVPEALTTLAERLRAHGYDTAGIVTNANVGRAFGLDRGFDEYELLNSPEEEVGYGTSDMLVDRAVEWLELRSENSPFFLYLHATDPHDPYAFSGTVGDDVGTVPFMRALESGDLAASPEIRRELLKRYDKEIVFADAEFGRFLDKLKGLGLYESSLIVVLSDHGEEFGEHGWWRHGKTLYNEQLWVPLVIKWPDGLAAGTRVTVPVQHIDLLPTVMETIAEGVPPELPGRSLLGIVENAGGESVRPIFGYLGLDDREVESVVYSNRKLVRYRAYDRSKPAAELFDLSEDPEESSNRFIELPAATMFLESALGRARPGPALESQPIVIDEELERRLRALGYVP